MKKIGLALAVFLFLFPGASTGSEASSPFAPVFDLLDHLRAGDDVKVDLRVGATTFGVYREESEVIDKKTFDSLLASKPLAPVGLEFRREGLAIVHEVTSNLSLGETIQEGGTGAGHPSTWFKNASIRIGFYPIGEWGEFLKNALNHGLLECDAIRDKDYSLIELIFKGTGPASVKYNSGSIAFPDSFYEHMKVSERFKPSSGSNGFAILVHDPHSSVSGALQLVPGLKSLMDANSHAGFVFLVEGGYDPARGRRIELGQLGQIFDHVQNRTRAEGLVSDLLSRYMIDSPTAYRLLYDRKLESFAIDDLGHLGKTSPSESIQDASKIRGSIDKFKGVVEKLPWPDTADSRRAKRSIIQALGIARLYADADLDGADDQTMVDYFHNLSETLNNLTNLGEKLQEASPSIVLNPVINELRVQTKSCDREFREYSDAIQRNVTMGQYIAEYARQSGRRIPIAFIGNFHTHGITNQLRTQKIGYVVVEPHLGFTTRQELDSFDHMLYSDTRPEYLGKLPNLHKLDVMPSDAEINKYYVPYLDRRVRNVEALDGSLKQRFSLLLSSGINYQRFSDALRRNPSLMMAGVEFGGGGGGIKPPSGFENSFAFFEPEGPNANARLVVLDPNDGGWRSDSRYRYLEEALLALPSPGSSNENRSIVYYDRASNRLLAGLYEPMSKRFYMFDGGDKIAGVLAQMAALRPGKGQGTSVRITVTELIRLSKTWRPKNG